MKHPLFKDMGQDYPIHLETQFDRILVKLETLWGTSLADVYLSELIIDRRGGRQGFPEAVLGDLIRICEFRELQSFRSVERKEDAIEQLRIRGAMRNEVGFLRALNAGDKDLVDLYLRSGIALPPDDGWGVPLLQSALKKGHTIVAKILLDAGVDVNSRDKLGLTPLHVACGKPTSGYRDVAEALIERGANVNVRDPLGNTPLLLALTGGMFDIALLLIDRGANIYVTSRKGETPLSLAQRSDRPDAIAVVKAIENRPQAFGGQRPSEIAPSPSSTLDGLETAELYDAQPSTACNLDLPETSDLASASGWEDESETASAAP
jgi:uncharacterized protein